LKSLTVVFFLFICAFALSQKTEFYIKSGGLFGAPIGPANEGDKGFLKFGSSFGLQMRYKLAKSISLGGELLLSNKKGGYDSAAEGDTTYAYYFQPNQPPVLFPTYYKGRVKGDFDNAYLELPITINYKYKRSNIHLGGYGAYLISGSHTGKTDLVIGNDFSKIKEDFDDSKYLVKYDFGVIFGGEFDVVKNQLIFGFRGIYGLNSIFTADYPNVKDKFSNLYMNFYIAIKAF
jgi:hypothetical protein